MRTFYLPRLCFCCGIWLFGYHSHQLVRSRKEALQWSQIRAASELEVMKSLIWPQGVQQYLKAG